MGSLINLEELKSDLETIIAKKEKYLIFGILNYCYSLVNQSRKNYFERLSSFESVALNDVRIKFMNLLDKENLEIILNKLKVFIEKYRPNIERYVEERSDLVNEIQETIHPMAINYFIEALLSLNEDELELANYFFNKFQKTLQSETKVIKSEETSQTECAFINTELEDLFIVHEKEYGMKEYGKDRTNYNGYYNWKKEKKGLQKVIEKLEILYFIHKESEKSVTDSIIVPKMYYDSIKEKLPIKLQNKAYSILKDGKVQYRINITSLFDDSLDYKIF